MPEDATAGARVLLTGVTGFLGQHCGAELLRRGYEVVGTTRSVAGAADVVSGISGVAPADRLTLRELDLTEDRGWDEAMAGCSFVLHVASPYVLAAPRDERELIVPAVEGTLRVVAAARRAGVRRLVLTSSIAAITAGRGSGRFGPGDWADVDARIGAYARSKALAERAAWDAVAGGDMELVVINPGEIVGPTLTGRVDGHSLEMIARMMRGEMPVIADVGLGMVDVRDVARLHAAALTAERAAGRRFIAATAEPVELSWVAGVLRDLGYPKATPRTVPTPVLRVLSLVSRAARGALPFAGQRASLDNSATISLLDWAPTPIEASIRDMARSIAGPPPPAHARA